MDEDRFVISDALWEPMWPLLPGKVGDPGANGRNNRRFMEAVLWRVRTGSPWRDLPKDFGNWNSVLNGSADAPMPVCLRVFSKR